MMTDPLLKKVKETMAQYRMVSPGERVIIAVSGGPDSVCLLDVLHKIGPESGLKLSVAHFNHGLRPAEDGRETEFVKALAGSLDLPFITAKADSELHGRGSSLEERAREARYRFLESVRTEQDAVKIALGHTMNDQAETVFMRLLRGSGPSGLAGIPPVRGGIIIRPLLKVKRREIEEYLKRHNLSSRLDSSNLTPTHLRNRIRLEILPLLTQLQPNLVERMALTADILRGEDEYIEISAQEWIRDAIGPGEGNSIAIPLDSFHTLHEALKKRVLRALMKKIKLSLLRIDYDHVLAVSGLINSRKPQGRLDLPGGLVVIKAYDRLEMTLKERKPENYQYILEGPGKYYLHEINRTLTLTIIPNSGAVSDHPEGSLALLDADSARFPLLVRNFRPGDRFVPLGMAGHKKIKDFFIDRKVRDKERVSTPILFSGRTPVWVCGYRIDDRFKVTSSTRRILKAVIDLI